ncbi:MAG: hypothetical protein ACRELY_13335 [Polyangiaceae bacterium]
MKSAIVASDSVVAEHAGALLTTGAVEAVIAGALVAAAREASVLFGPLQILIGGAGAGLLAVDGRVRQPGLGAARPRGFREEDEIPDAAYVGAPAFAAAAFAALALSGNDATRATFAPALAAARTLSKSRHELLDRISRNGAFALADSATSSELVAAVGRISGGLLTAKDLASAKATVEKCVVHTNIDREIACAPWSTAARASSSTIHFVLAADARGRVAAASYEVSSDAVPLSAFDLAAPRHASPVLRGKERVRPGDTLPACAPLAIFQTRAGWEAIVGAGDLTTDGIVERGVGSIADVVRKLGSSARAIARADDRLTVLSG